MKNISNWAIFVLMVMVSALCSEPMLDLETKTATLPTQNDYAALIHSAILTEQLHQEIACVATAVYYESRGEIKTGKVAVARVIQNRIDANFAPTACGVVYQKAEGRCQFTWACSTPKHLDRSKCPECWDAAWEVFAEHQHQNLVKEALYFHETTVVPKWNRLSLVSRIGHHNFYKKSPKIISRRK